VLSEAQKASQKLKRAANQSFQENLSEDLNNLLVRHQEELEALAARHGKTMEYLDKLRGTSRHYKMKREVGLANAKLHAKSMEVNNGLLLIILRLLQCPYTNACLQTALLDHA